MSLSPDDFEESVEWFIGLDSADKGRIIEGIETEGENVSRDELAHVRGLINLIQEKVSEGGRSAGIEYLVDEGVQEQYASLLVEKTLENRPPLRMKVQDLQSIPIEDFQNIVEKTLLSHIGCSMELDVDEDSIETSMQSLMISVDEALGVYLRGENTISGIKKQYQENGLDEERSDYIAGKIEEHGDMIHKRQVFKYLQEIRYNEMQDLKDQQRKTRQLMDDVLRIIEDAARESDT